MDDEKLREQIAILEGELEKRKQLLKTPDDKSLQDALLLPLNFDNPEPKLSDTAKQISELHVQRLRQELEMLKDATLRHQIRTRLIVVIATILLGTLIFSLFLMYKDPTAKNPLLLAGGAMSGILTVIGASLRVRNPFAPKADNKTKSP